MARLPRPAAGVSHPPRFTAEAGCERGCCSQGTRARSGGVDVVTAEGLAAALAGVGGIVDVATGPSPEQQAATEFFTTAARNLQLFFFKQRTAYEVAV